MYSFYHRRPGCYGSALYYSVFWLPIGSQWVQRFYCRQREVRLLSYSCSRRQRSRGCCLHCFSRYRGILLCSDVHAIAWAFGLSNRRWWYRARLGGCSIWSTHYLSCSWITDSRYLSVSWHWRHVGYGWACHSSVHSSHYILRLGLRYAGSAHTVLTCFFRFCCRFRGVVQRSSRWSYVRNGRIVSRLSEFVWTDNLHYCDGVYCCNCCCASLLWK
mmetsp:Transcript_121431/g.190482  ORF Transcript_121431/g.190482 Transcript_121431/m.190482 type:complete len:216 (+) Transcript_121431:275-922(+)